MMSKKDRLLSLISYYSSGNKTAFAAMLGIKPQSINSWIIRDTYDIDLVYSKCVGVSAEWLLTGTGPMLRDEVRSKEEKPADQRAAVSDELLDKIEQQAHEIARLQGKIESQNDFIALIIKTLVENSGGGEFARFALGEVPCIAGRPHKHLS